MKKLLCCCIGLLLFVIYRMYKRSEFEKLEYEQRIREAEKCCPYFIEKEGNKNAYHFAS